MWPTNSMQREPFEASHAMRRPSSYPMNIVAVATVAPGEVSSAMGGAPDRHTSYATAVQKQGGAAAGAAAATAPPLPREAGNDPTPLLLPLLLPTLCLPASAATSAAEANRAAPAAAAGAPHAAPSDAKHGSGGAKTSLCLTQAESSPLLDCSPLPLSSKRRTEQSAETLNTQSRSELSGAVWSAQTCTNTTASRWLRSKSFQGTHPPPAFVRLPRRPLPPGSAPGLPGRKGANGALDLPAASAPRPQGSEAVPPCSSNDTTVVRSLRNT